LNTVRRILIAAIIVVVALFALDYVYLFSAGSSGIVLIVAAAATILLIWAVWAFRALG
ncbi:MAG: hypothetical protein QOI37_1607, partial [Chloroflexota bacterium]|jgi:hypothetical protein|nr:hypothetical protein [Chloroflexota bacterium]